MTSIRMCAAAAATAAALASLGVIHHASAHDVHTFGPYTVALGWLHEPAYLDVDNAVQCLVKDQKGAPVTGIDGLSVDVSLGSASMTGLKLAETADPDTGLGTPGDYEANFIPTAPGNYTFHVRGTISGTAIDDDVAASPSTFNEVQTGDSAQFPTRIPAISDISTKVDAVSARVGALPSQVQTVESTASDAKDAGNRALVVGVIALVLGVLLGIANVVLMVRSRRLHGAMPSGAAAPPQS